MATDLMAKYATGPPLPALEFTILQMICTLLGVILIIYNLSRNNVYLDKYLSPHSIMFMFVLGMFVALLGESSMDQSSLAIRLGAMLHGIGEVIICFFILHPVKTARKYGKRYLILWILTIYIACWLFKPINAFVSIGVMLVTGDAFVFVTGLSLIFANDRGNVTNLVKIYGAFILIEFINGFVLVIYGFFSMDNAIIWTFQSYRWVLWMFFMFIFLKKSEKELKQIGFLYNDNKYDQVDNVDIDSENDIEIEAEIVSNSGNGNGLFSRQKMESITYSLTLTMIIALTLFGSLTVIALSVGAVTWTDFYTNEDGYYYPGPHLAIN